MTPTEFRAALKEAHDQYRWRTSSWRDMTANALGYARGLGLSRAF